MIYQLPCICMHDDETYYWLLSICTSYAAPTENPTMEDCKRLQEFLGAPEMPAWYLDGEEPRWGRKSIRCRV